MPFEGGKKKRPAVIYKQPLSNKTLKIGSLFVSMPHIRKPCLGLLFVVTIEVGEVSYQLIARHEAHKRIIWTCSWNPYCHEFATGSRDRTVKIWAVQNGTSVKQLMILPQFKNSITALSWVGDGGSGNGGLLAIGMDDGLIELWRVSGGSAAPALRFHPFLCHVSTVHRLAWRRNNMEDGDGTMQLASCGADHSVRVFQVNLSR